LSIQVEEVKLWFAHLLTSTTNQYGSFRQNLASFRHYSRQNGHLNLDYLETDIKKSNHSDFAVFIEGLKREVPQKPTKQARAIPKELLSDLLVDITLHEPHEPSLNRDISMFAPMFLNALRGCDIYNIDLEQPKYVLLNNSIEVDLFGGKTNKTVVGMFVLHGEGHTIDIVSIFRKHLASMHSLYGKGILTADKNGRRSLFNTIKLNHQTGEKETQNTRIKTNIISKILRERLYAFLNEMKWNGQMKRLMRLSSSFLRTA
jgi:hypothetical protein